MRASGRRDSGKGDSGCDASAEAAPGRGEAASPRSGWTSALLEELIYERARLSVDFAKLVTFERDLQASIDRALATCGGRSEDRKALAREHLERAWARLEREWRCAREREDDPLQCPLCGELTGFGALSSPAAFDGPDV